MKSPMDEAVELELSKRNKLFKGDFAKTEKFGNGYLATVYGPDLRPRSKWHVMEGRPMTLVEIDLE
ncbi:MAG TPA: hypothetical protein VGL56_21140 [Fimbriimonadaceae bacterium]|jgi:hypothetical protein